jgi:hypothetical protein
MRVKNRDTGREGYRMDFAYFCPNPPERGIEWLAYGACPTTIHWPAADGGTALSSWASAGITD